MIFRTTEQIFKGGLVFEDNWLDVGPGELTFPLPDGTIDSKKEISYEKVEFWEVIKESGGGNGIYAAYQPWAEIYLVRHHDKMVEVFSGKNANLRAEAFCIKMGIEYPRVGDPYYATV
jgi:hypothetical protein